MRLSPTRDWLWGLAYTSFEAPQPLLIISFSQGLNQTAPGPVLQGPWVGRRGRG